MPMLTVEPACLIYCGKGTEWKSEAEQNGLVVECVIQYGQIVWREHNRHLWVARCFTCDNWGLCRSRPARSIWFFQWWLFHPKWCIFHCLNIPQNSPKVTPAEKCHNLLLSSISTTRWCYNQGKCVLAHNVHMLCAHSKPLYPCFHGILLNLVI